MASLEEISAAKNRRYYQDKSDREKRENGSVSSDTQSKIDYWTDAYKSAWNDSNPDKDYDIFHRFTNPTANPAPKTNSTRPADLVTTASGLDVSSGNEDESAQQAQEQEPVGSSLSPRIEIPEDRQASVNAMLDRINRTSSMSNAGMYDKPQTESQQRFNEAQAIRRKEHNDTGQDAYAALFGDSVLDEKPKKDAGTGAQGSPTTSGGGVSHIINKDKIEYADSNEKRLDILRHYGVTEDDYASDPSVVGQSNLESDNPYESVIDDGNMLKRNLTSLYMTGKQYKKYVEATGTGRPIDEIDDNQIYNKLTEKHDYNFVPYLPDWNTELMMQLDDMSSAPSRLLGNLGTARENLLHYTRNYNGKSIDGNNFDKESEKYFKSAIDQMQDESRWNDDPNSDHTGMTPYKTMFIYNDEDTGEEVRINGKDYEVVSADPNDPSKPVEIYFPNHEIDGELGATVVFNDLDEANSALKHVVAAIGEESMADSWVNLDPFVMSDGTELTFQEAYDMSVNEAGENDYGFANIFKPGYMQDDFWTDDGFNLDDLVPKMIDITLGSAPYFSPYTSIPLALSNARLASQGIDPDTASVSPTSSMLSSDLTNEHVQDAIIGNIAMPLTEIGLGRIGGSLATKPLKGLANKVGERAWMPGATWATGTIGEGLEEIPGDIVDEYRRNGAAGMFASQLTDENGNPLYDDSGHAVLDTSTSFDDRLGRYGEGIKESFTGGALLGAGFGLSPSEVKGTIADTQAIRARNQAAKDAGLGIYRPGREGEIMSKYKYMTADERRK